MPIDRTVRRYTAYFRDWCQAFGEHEDLSSDDDDTIDWLFGEKRVGFILPGSLTRALHREVLGKQRESPVLTISPDCVQVGKLHYRLSKNRDKPGIKALQEIMEPHNALHLYLTYHFMYEPGTRIITLTHKQPLPIIYKEISPMHIVLRD